MVPHDIATCIALCQECQRSCIAAAIGLPRPEEREPLLPEQLRLVLDCADTCQFSASLLIRQSPFHGRSCALTAAVCRRCAEDCESAADERLLPCADACRRCADACEEMAAEQAESR